MNLRNTLMASAAILTLAGVSASAAQKDIVDTAVGAGQFKTLAAALTAAGLVDTLKGEGPFTVFAPTDDAFAKLPKGTVETLLKPENKDQLVDILTYHVVSGKVPAKVALTLDKATAVNKKEIKLSKKDGSLFLNQSKVVKTDIECSNGIIHVIDAVLLPPKKKNASFKRGDAERLVRTAIHEGVPVFNHGNHAACTAVYTKTAQALVEMPEAAVSPRERAMLQVALNKTSDSKCMTTNAWTLRHAFDQMLASSH